MRCMDYASIAWNDKEKRLHGMKEALHFISFASTIDVYDLTMLKK